LPEAATGRRQRQLEVDDGAHRRGSAHDKNMPERLMLTDWVP